MAKKVACKNCKALLDDDKCPNCASSVSTSSSWSGRIVVSDPELSMLAKTLGYTKKGEYAIKIR